MRRVRLTMEQYQELVDARDWSAKNGYDSFKRWYDEELAFQSRRRALPIGVQVREDEIEERPRGRW